MLILLITQQANDSHSDFTLKVLSVLGAVGFALVLGLAQSLQSDIEGLRAGYRLLKGIDDGQES